MKDKVLRSKKMSKVLVGREKKKKIGQQKYLKR